PASLRGASPRSVCFAACGLARTRAGEGFTVHRYRSRMQAALLPGALTLIALGAASALARPPAAQPLPVRHAGDGAFAALEHEYVTYMLREFPVVATYLGGATFDPQLADIDGMLRDYSPEALQKEGARLGEFRARFAALAPATLSARRRVDRSVALAQIAFLVHQHEVRRHQLRSLDSYTDEPVRGVDWQIQGMSTTGPATRGTDREWRAAIARARAVPAYLATARRQLAAGVAAHRTPDWRMLSAFGLESTAADAEYFGSTLGQIAAEGAQHAPVGRAVRGDARGELTARGSEIGRHRARTGDRRAPFPVGPAGCRSRRAHALNLPVDSAHRLVRVGIERAQLVAPHLMLVHEERDLGERHRAIDTPPRRESRRGERGEAGAEFAEPGVLLLQRLGRIVAQHPV